MKLQTKIIGGISWQAAGLISQIVLNLIFLVILARILTPKEFGIMAILRALLAMVEVFMEFGFGAALIQRTQIDAKYIVCAFHASIVLGAILYIFAVTASSFLTFAFFNAISSDLMLVFFSIIVIRSFAIVPRALLVRDFEFKKIFYATLLSTIIGNLLLGIPLALYGYGVWSLVVAFVSVGLINAFLLFFMRPHKVFEKYTIDVVKNIFSYGWNLTVYRFFSQAGMQADKFFIGKIFDVESLGLYERAIYFTNLPKAIVGGSVSNVAFSAFSRLREDANARSKAFQVYVGSVFFLMAALCQFFYFYPDIIIQILLGDQWMAAVPLMEILAVLVLLQSLTRFLDPIVRSENLMKKAIPIKALFALIVVVTLYLSSQSNMLPVVAMSLIVPTVVHVLLMLRLVLKALGIKWKELHLLLVFSVAFLLYFILKEGVIMLVGADTSNLLDSSALVLVDIIYFGLCGSILFRLLKRKSILS